MLGSLKTNSTAPCFRSPTGNRALHAISIRPKWRNSCPPVVALDRFLDQRGWEIKVTVDVADWGGGLDVGKGD